MVSVAIIATGSYDMSSMTHTKINKAYRQYCPVISLQSSSCRQPEALQSAWDLYLHTTKEFFQTNPFQAQLLRCLMPNPLDLEQWFSRINQRLRVIIQYYITSHAVNHTPSNQPIFLFHAVVFVSILMAQGAPGRIKELSCTSVALSLFLQRSKWHFSRQQKRLLHWWIPILSNAGPIRSLTSKVRTVAYRLISVTGPLEVDM